MLLQHFDVKPWQAEIRLHQTDPGKYKIVRIFSKLEI
jgi:hypothetical protein